jgi:membrane glycosyltransferase
VETPANAAEYLASLTTPIALYLVCAAALPGEVPEAGLDLAGSYFAERRYFFGVLLVYLLSTAVNTMVVARVWQWNAINMLRLGVLVLGASLLFSRARWYHWTATILFGALLLLRMLNMTARPG